MGLPPPPDHEDALRSLDWPALTASARRRLRARMSGFGAQDIEDAVQEVSERMVKFVRRHGRPDSPEGLLLRIVRAVAANAIHRRQRERALQSGDLATWLDEPPGDGSEEHVLEEYRRIAFSVREYFRLRRAGCLPLAEAKSRGESLKEHAARQRQSHEQVRQAWARCRRLILDAIRRNRLRIDWVLPRRREASGE